MLVSTIGMLVAMVVRFRRGTQGQMAEARRDYLKYLARTREAVRQGIIGSAGAVTSAAVVMVAVFAIFATLSAPEFKQLGVGLAAAVFIDATLVRAVLLPAAMTLLGRWNWWSPGPLARAYRRYGLRESEALVEPGVAVRSRIP